MRAELQRLRSQRAGAHPRAAVPIFASDVSFRMVDFARRNAERAGVAHAITFNGGDALERPAPALPADLPGTLMLNPPYGERIEVGGKAGAARRRPTSRESAETTAADAERLLRPPARTGSAPTPRTRPAGRPGCSAPT